MKGGFGLETSSHRGSERERRLFSAEKLKKHFWEEFPCNRKERLVIGLKVALVELEEI